MKYLEKSAYLIFVNENKTPAEVIILSQLLKTRLLSEFSVSVNDEKLNSFLKNKTQISEVFHNDEINISITIKKTKAIL
jgi:hypothetical protein